ncbi:hypothetical protein GGH95_004855, partial [Coemansia sp. RSA 1836]
IFGSGAKSAATSPTSSRHHHRRRSASSSDSEASESNSFVQVIDTPTVRASKHSNFPPTVLHRREHASALRVSSSADTFASPHRHHRRHEMPPVPPLPDSPPMPGATVAAAAASESRGGSGNKLMMRLLPRSSRMAFTGIFGRGDKKTGVQTEPH